MATSQDVRDAADAVVAMLAPIADGPAWDAPAGQLEWTCRHTLAHTVDCLYWYASNLARRSTANVGSPDVADTMALTELLDSLRSGAALLAVAVATAGPDDRAWHPAGMADASGFAGMSCDELLVHGYDLAGGLGVAFDPPSGPVERTVRRLFPWAPTDADPWAALLWANGRQPLGDQPAEVDWEWQCAPLAEWDGKPHYWHPE